MKRLFRKWLHTWALLDILVLGGGLVAGWMYLTYWDQHHTTPDPWLDIWPNLTTEIMGAWLSVRIINHLLQRRERRSSVRWRHADFANYMKDLGRAICRYPEGGDLDRLSDEVEFYSEPHNVLDRRRYLDASERDDLDEMIRFAEVLVKEARDLQLNTAEAEKLEWGSSERERVTSQIDSKREALVEAGNHFITQAAKARRNVLEEEFSTH